MSSQDSSPMRKRISAASYPLISKLHALPKPILPLVTFVLVVIGAFAPSAVAVVALLLVAVALAWLGYLSWPAVTTGSKLLRVFAVLIVLAFAWSRLST